MARLTWRDVAAPNYTPAMQGYQMFSDMLNNAFSSARQGINTVENAFADRDNKDFMSEILAADSPDAARSILAGLPTRDTRRITNQNMMLAAGRPGQLINEQLQDLNLQDTRFNFDNKVDLRRRENAAEGDMRDYFFGALAGDAGAASRFAGSDGAQQLRSSQLLSALTGGGNLESGSLGRQSSRQNLEFGAERQGWERQNQDWRVEDRQAGIEGSALAQEALASSGGDMGMAIGAIQGSAASPRAKQMAIEALGGTGLFASLAAGGGAGGGGGGLPAGMGDAGGSYDNYVVALESGGRATAKNPNSSATGMHQFTNKTWLGTVRDANPAWARGMTESQILAQRNTPARSAEMERHLRGQNAAILGRMNAPATNANLYAMHHFGTGNGPKFVAASPETRMESIFSKEVLDANPYLRGKTKAQVVGNWNQRAGSSTSTAPATAPIANDASRRATMTDSQRSLGADFAEVWNDRTSAGGVADKLVAKDAVFAGGDPGVMSTTINNLATRYRISPAIVGRMMEKSAVGYKPSTVLGFNTGNAIRNYGNNRSVNMETLNGLLGKATSGGLLQDVQLERVRGQQREASTTLAAQIQGIEQRMSRIRQMGGNSAAAQRNIAELALQKSMLEAQYQQIENAMVNDSVTTSPSAPSPTRRPDRSLSGAIERRLRDAESFFSIPAWMK